MNSSPAGWWRVFRPKGTYFHNWPQIEPAAVLYMMLAAASYTRLLCYRWLQGASLIVALTALPHSFFAVSLIGKPGILSKKSGYFSPNICPEAASQRRLRRLAISAVLSGAGTGPVLQVKVGNSSSPLALHASRGS